VPWPLMLRPLQAAGGEGEEGGEAVQQVLVEEDQGGQGDQEDGEGGREGRGEGHRGAAPEELPRAGAHGGGAGHQPRLAHTHPRLRPVLRTFPTADVIFRDAYASILPAGAMVDKVTSCAFAPLQSVLDRTVSRSQPGGRRPLHPHGEVRHRRAVRPRQLRLISFEPETPEMVSCSLFLWFLDLVLGSGS